LLDRFCDRAEGEHGLTLKVAEDNGDPLSAMHSLAEQAQERDCSASRFLKLYAKYYEAIAHLLQQPEAHEFAGYLGGAVAGMVLEATAFAVSPVAPVVPAVAPSVRRPAAEAGSRFGVFVARRLRDREQRMLVLNPEGHLTREFLGVLANAPKEAPVALFFDTYERTGTYLDKWLRTLLHGHYGPLPGNVLFTIAGQKELNQPLWADLEHVIRRLRLEPFTIDEAREYLQLRGVTDERLIGKLVEVSNRLPIILSWLTPVSGSAARDLGVASESAVEWFLRSLHPDQRPPAVEVALARSFNKDILGVVTGEEGVNSRFRWLQELPIVDQVGDAWTYHEAVRPHLVHYGRRESPRRWLEIHRRLAEHHEQQATTVAADLEAEAVRKHQWIQRQAEAYGIEQEAEGWGYALPDVSSIHLQLCSSSVEWNRHKAEAAYHRLCEAWQRNLPLVLDELVVHLALSHLLDASWERSTYAVSLRAWAGVLRQAGADTKVEHLTSLGTLLDCFALSLSRDAAPLDVTIGNMTDALGTLDTALGGSPEGAEVRVALGAFLESYDEPERAEVQYRRALAIGNPPGQSLATAYLWRLLHRQPRSAQDAERLLTDALVAGRLTPLDVAILRQKAIDEVRGSLAAMDIYALGYPAGDTSQPGRGTESNLIHYTFDDSAGRERVALPVFSQPWFMRDALLLNPDWQRMPVLRINGAELLANVDTDVKLVINPWTTLEFQLPEWQSPPSAHRLGPESTPGLGA
jgi:hypothetical protein